ncbi:MAG: M24 family metallopeptidase [Ignavibacteria bacterium]|nr:M24 family metallopeptidase [Ignavibacteria bacterium]
MNIEAIQKELKNEGLDGWLFYDFHNRDPIAIRILEIDSKRFTSRRWFYFIPSDGTPKKLVHRIESWKLDHLPGEKFVYLPWEELHSHLRQILSGTKRIAMQYSPRNSIPYVSNVDAGTVELVRSMGIDVVSSANLVSLFEAHLTDKEIQTHSLAGELMHKVKDFAFMEIARRIRNGDNPTEYEIHCYMLELFKEFNLITNDGPIVAINEHAADPHFEPTETNCYTMKEGDLVLLDLWAKLDQPKSIYYDITWMGYIGTSVPQRLTEIFNIVVRARNNALKLVQDRFERNIPLFGFEVDDAARKVIIDAGYGKFFTHRTGHNIGEEVHGNGTHMDNLETRDERKIIPGSCFSIEPGIYLPEEKIGFRSEIDVVITNKGEVVVYGDIQEEIIPILTLG